MHIVIIQRILHIIVKMTILYAAMCNGYVISRNCNMESFIRTLYVHTLLTQTTPYMNTHAYYRGTHASNMRALIFLRDCPGFRLLHCKQKLL